MNKMPKPSHAHQPPPPPSRYPQGPQRHPPPPNYPQPIPSLPQHPPPPHRPSKPPKPRRTTLASCIVATVFLIFIIILFFIVYFSLFKPKDPRITITAVQIPTFTVSTNSTRSTISFTFSQYAAVHNPNHAVFSHFDSSFQLLYSGNQVGFMFIPAGNISAGRTDYMAATFSVQSFPIMASQVEGDVPAMLLPPVTDGFDHIQPTMELESRTEMVGRVKVMKFFTHHVETVAECRVTIAINDGSVLGFHC